jgi:hypothetical protein
VTFGLMYCDLWISTFKKEYFPRKLFAEIRYTKRKPISFIIAKIMCDVAVALRKP